MAKFKDLKGREWDIVFTAPVIREVRKEPTSFDLVAYDNSISVRLRSDPLLAQDVLWTICEKQAKERGVAVEDFYASAIGDATESGIKALEEARDDFFPSDQRKVLRTLADRQAAITAKGIELAIRKTGDPDIEKKLLARLEAEIDEKINLLTRSSSSTSGQVAAESK